MLQGSKRIVVVGAGHAGGHAAMAARAAAPSADIVLIGSERFPPYERPPLSKALLLGTSDAEKTFLRPAAHYRDNTIDLRLGATVVGIDRAAGRVLIDGQASEPYDELILTLGARPRVLPIPGGRGRAVFYLRDIDDSLALRAALAPGARVAVIGAGLIGLEVAASARMLGCKVVVLEMAGGPMQRVLAPEVARFFGRLHADRGVELLFNTTVSAIGDSGSVLAVETSSETIEVDLVVIGIGAIPNQELAAAAGLTVDDGVVVDEFGRTSDPAISAAGDVTRHYNPILERHIRLESWQNAQNQALAVGRNAGGDLKPHAEVPWSWSDQYDVNLQAVGLPLTWDRLVWRGDCDGPSFTVFYLKGDRVVGANAVNNARDIRAARMLIERGLPVSAPVLADPAVKLADLAKQAVNITV